MCVFESRDCPEWQYPTVTIGAKCFRQRAKPTSPLNSCQRNREFPEQQHKQRRSLAASFDHNQFFRLSLLSAQQITLLVSTRRKHMLLLAAKHPVIAEFGVQMDIDLILPNDHLIGRQVSLKPLDTLQTLLPTRTLCSIPQRVRLPIQVS